MLKIVVLICPLVLEHSACNQDTAIDVVRAERVRSPEQCGFMAQAMVASTVLAPAAEYVKVMCVRTGAVAVGG